jgi:hypothetical protein
LKLLATALISRSGHFSIDPSAGSGNRCRLNECDRRRQNDRYLSSVFLPAFSSGIGFAITAVMSYKEIVRG